MQDLLLLAEHKKGIRSAHIRDGNLEHIAFDAFFKKNQGILDDIVSCRVISRRHDFVWVDAGLDLGGVIKTTHFHSQLPPEGKYIWAQISRMPWLEDSTHSLHEKGYRLTPRITLAGKYWLYAPFMKSQHQWTMRSSAAISKLDSSMLSAEKESISGTAQRLLSPPTYLGLFHRALNQWQRFIRDHDNITVICETAAIAEMVRQWLEHAFLSTIPEIQIANLKQYPLFEYFGIEDEWENCLLPTVFLKGGGTLDIRECAAATLIDINKGSSLTDPFEFNKLCISFLKKQLVWRNISGNILIDFIRMPKNLNIQLNNLMINEFKDTDFKILGFCELGLMQIQRKRLRPSIAHQLK